MSGRFVMTCVLPYMARENKGAVARLVGLHDRPTNTAGKGAEIALTRQVAAQVAGTGVRCNCICPGTIDSPWVARLLAESDGPDHRRAELLARKPNWAIWATKKRLRRRRHTSLWRCVIRDRSKPVIDCGLVAR